MKDMRKKILLLAALALMSAPVLAGEQLPGTIEKIGTPQPDQAVTGAGLPAGGQLPGTVEKIGAPLPDQAVTGVGITADNVSAAAAPASGQLSATVEIVNVSMLERSGTAAAYPAEVLSAGEDCQLAVQKDNFMKFAAVKVREMNSNHILSRSRMHIEKGPDGLYRAFFHEIDDTSMTCEVNRSQFKSVPYVAVLSYKERVFSSSCATPAECRQGQFRAVEEIPSRHIFVLKNGSWQ